MIYCEPEACLTSLVQDKDLFAIKTLSAATPAAIFYDDRLVLKNV
jgi:hypothetical protein